LRGSTNALLCLAAATLALRYLEAAVLILPPFGRVNVVLWLVLPAALLVCGAIWLLAWQFAGRLLQEKLSSRAAPAR
jgi:cytochrome c-type biogenesis protein CcmH/NrfF